MRGLMEQLQALILVSRVTCLLRPGPDPGYLRVFLRLETTWIMLDNAKPSPRLIPVLFVFHQRSFVIEHFAERWHFGVKQNMVGLIQSGAGWRPAHDTSLESCWWGIKSRIKAARNIITISQHNFPMSNNFCCRSKSLFQNWHWMCPARINWNHNISKAGQFTHWGQFAYRVKIILIKSFDSYLKLSCQKFLLKLFSVLIKHKNKM